MFGGKIMTPLVYLISKIWTDQLENRNAVGYEPIGIIHSTRAAEKFVLKGRTFTKKDCWQIYDDMPEFTMEAIEVLD
jgi:hypothetical protein